MINIHATKFEDTDKKGYTVICDSQDDIKDFVNHMKKINPNFAWRK